MPCNISIVNDDCLKVARTLDNPCVLNLANASIIGGGVQWTIDNTQEENLCRRSTLYRSLSHMKYPMSKNEIFYSPNVCVLKDVEYNDCETFDVSLITAAAKQDPLISDKGGYENEEDHIDLTKIVFNIFSTACLHGHRNIVLGALGCGVFKNPTKEVATIFRQVLKDFFPTRFDNVIFAILERDSNTPLNDVFNMVFELS